MKEFSHILCIFSPNPFNGNSRLKVSLQRMCTCLQSRGANTFAHGCIKSQSACLTVTEAEIQ